MEFTCEKKDLQKGISLVERIVSVRSTLPIIGNVLLEAGKSGIKVLANNLEIGIELIIPAKVVKGGAILLSAKTLTSIVSKLPDGSVDFKLSEKGSLRISYSDSHFNVNTLPPDEFPVLPKVKEEKSIKVAARRFAEMIRYVIFSTSQNEEKYILTGVLLEAGSGIIAGDQSNLRLIATDGYRLAKIGERIKLEGEKLFSVIVPSRALQEVMRIIESTGSEEEIKITFSSDQVSFKCQDTYLVSRIVQGQFPDYKQVIPKKTTARLVAERETLLAAAERTAIIAAGSANLVRFEFREGKLHLLASTPDVGNINEILEAEIKGKEKIQIAFNIRLITDVLKVLETEKIVIEFTDTLGPGVIKADKKDDYVYIVMPIRTQEAV